MITARAHLKSAAPVAFNRQYYVPKLNKESSRAYEERTWRERCHVNGGGNVIIPATFFAGNIRNAAHRLQMRVPDKGRKTFIQHFAAGVVVFEGIDTGVHIEDVPGLWLSLPSNGRRGGGARVLKCMPYVNEWEGVVEYFILDDAITQDVFTEHLLEGGRFIGIGRWRPEKEGLNGRFDVTKVEWGDGSGAPAPR